MLLLSVIGAALWITLANTLDRPENTGTESTSKAVLRITAGPENHRHNLATAWPAGSNVAKRSTEAKRFKSGHPVFATDVLDYQLSEIGGQLLYRRSEGQPSPLYLTDISGNESQAVAPALFAAGAKLEAYQLAPNGETAVLRAQVVNEATRSLLYRVDTQNPSEVEPLYAAQAWRGDATDYAYAPDSEAVVYLANRDDYGKMELYVSWLDPAGANARLNPELTLSGNVVDFAFAGDGRYVIYRADLRVDEHYNLHMVNLRQPGLSVQLNPTLPDWADVGAFRIAADGETVFYQADTEQTGRFIEHQVSIFQPGVPR